MRAVVLITFLYVSRYASSYPTTVEHDPDSCLVMTPERQKQIDSIAEQVRQFIYNLSEKLEDVDIIDTRLTIEKHSDDEKEKNTTISVTINDCANEGRNADGDNCCGDADVIAEGCNSEDADDVAEDNSECDNNNNTCIEDTEKEESLTCPRNPSLEGLEVRIVHLNDKERQVVEEIERIRKNKPFLMFERLFNSSGVQNFIFF